MYLFRYISSRIFTSLLIVTAFTVSNFQFVNAQITDSIEINLLKHHSDTAILKKSLIQLLESKFVGTKKGDSLASIIMNQSERLKYAYGIALSNRYLGVNFHNKGDFKSSLSHFLKSLSQFNEIEDSALILITYQSLASSYFNIGKQDSAIHYCSKAIKSYQVRNEFKKLSSCYNTLGGIYWSKGDLASAADAFYKSLDIKVKLNDSLGIANTYNNIGILFDTQQKLPEALEMYNKSLEIYKKKSVKRGIGRAYNNIAIVLKNMNRCDEAIDMLLNSLEIDKQLGNIDDQGKTLNNIGQLYLKKNDALSALKYLNRAKEIFQNNKNINGETASIINIGRANSMLGNFQNALTYYDQGLLLAKGIQSLELINELYKELYKTHKKLGNTSLALTYHELNSTLSDSIKSLENLNKLDELKIKYETELKGSEITLLNKDRHIRELVIERQKSINRFLLLVMGLLLLLVCLVVIGWLTIRRDNQDLLLKNNEINQQKEEIEAQRDLMESFNNTLNQQNEEILAQRDQIEAKNTIISATNRRLTENIEYASRIQNALLPDVESIKNYFSDYYIIYKPKDIVSGDFYWMWPQKEKIFFSIADCTGHGVSGAFMSILAHNYLKDSVISKGYSRPNEIISFISNEVEDSLYSNIPKFNVKDGLDIIVCCYDKKDGYLEFSGAHSSFYLIRDNVLTCYKTDRYSIGGHMSSNVLFSNQRIKIQKGDKLVFFTDGYMDQLNMVTKKKIGGTNFKNLIHKTQSLTLLEQNQEILNFFNKWRGDYEQIDDVLIWTIVV
ncbi:MAG TPA: hypothetical protein DIW31_11240 [Bacteroidales bacterium]|nr:hypothetical protein [Bacteroidales bacterium]